MKLISYNDGEIGLSVQGRVINLSDKILGSRFSMKGLIENFDHLKPKIEDLATIAESSVSIDAIKLLPPISDPNKIVCTVCNYPEHAEEDKTEVFPKPIFFMKPPTTLVGSNGVVILPKFAQRVDHELELAVVMGKKCKNISAKNALDHVFGYSIFLDMSARDFRTIPYSWFSMKAWDTFGPLGPIITTADEIKDPQNLEMKLWVNGKLRMNGNTKDMIFKIEELIEAISEVTTLYPGDIIATGTIEGVAPVFEGDMIVAEIESLGSLVMTVSRSSHNDKWHTSNFPTFYSEYRARDAADQGEDPVAPQGI